MGKIIIAVDGYSSCGKSTIAKELANALGYVFIDSGAMYRAIALYFLEHQVDWVKEADVVAALENINLSFVLNDVEGFAEIHLNGLNVHSRIRDMDVAAVVSKVAALRLVRAFATQQQQLMGLEKGIVMDGRDVGTTVFPNAELKIFVTADIEERTRRRFEELRVNNPDIDYESIKANLLERDYIDEHRDESPLRRADDAKLLDNTHMTKAEQFLLVKEWSQAAIETARA